MKQFIETENIFEEIQTIQNIVQIHPNKKIGIIVLDPLLKDFLLTTFGLSKKKAPSFQNLLQNWKNEKSTLNFLAVLNHPECTLPDKFKTIHSIIEDFPKEGAQSTLYAQQSHLELSSASNLDGFVSNAASNNKEEQQVPYYNLSIAFDQHTNKDIVIIAGCNKKETASTFSLDINCDQIIFTRSKKIMGQITEPIKLWEKYCTEQLQGNSYLKKQKTLNKNNGFKPNPFKLPKYLTISGIELLLKDPFAFYIRYILKLNPSTKSMHKTKGLLFHKALETQNLAIPDETPDSVFWKYQLSTIFDHMKSNDSIRFKEKKGMCQLGDFTIEGRADRIDQIDTKTYVIIDYKTGTPPSIKDIKEGLAPQLPLLGYIAEQGGFGQKMKIQQLQYWIMRGYGKKPIEIIDLPNVTELIENVTQKILEILSNFDNYPIDVTDLSDFDHFKRV